MGTKRKPGKFDCYIKAQDDEPMFILLGRDPVAWAVLEYWIELRTIFAHELKQMPEQLIEAMSLVKDMKKWARERKPELIESVEAGIRYLEKVQSRAHIRQSRPQHWHERRENRIVYKGK